MRPAFLAAALLLALCAPVGSAQMAAPQMFEAEVHHSATLLEPGNGTSILVVLARLCPNQAAVLDEQGVDVRFQAPADFVAAVEGPMQAAFGQQVCAQEPRQARELAFTLYVAQNATRGSVAEVALLFTPQPSSGTSNVLRGPGEPLEHSLAFRVADAPAVTDAGSEPATMESPVLPGLLMALALLASAFALRRR